MKMNLKEFFENKKNRLYVGAGALAVVVFVTAGGIYASNRANQTHQLAKIEQEKKQAEEKQKEELAKKEKEEKEKLELAKAEEQKTKEDEEKKKEEVKKAEEEKKEQEQKQAEAKSEETKQSSNNNKNNNSNSNSNNNTKVVAKKETPKKNNSSNNNSNKKNNTFEVEGDGYPTNLGNSGMFFSTKGQADNWAFSQLENDSSSWVKSGYRRFATSQCKYNGKIGWTISFRK